MNNKLEKNKSKQQAQEDSDSIGTNSSSERAVQINFAPNDDIVPDFLRSEIILPSDSSKNNNLKALDVGNVKPVKSGLLFNLTKNLAPHSDATGSSSAGLQVDSRTASPFRRASYVALAFAGNNASNTGGNATAQPKVDHPSTFARTKTWITGKSKAPEMTLEAVNLKENRLASMRGINANRSTEEPISLKISYSEYVLPIVPVIATNEGDSLYTPLPTWKHNYLVSSTTD